jgi:hypothetical protein
MSRDQMLRAKELIEVKQYAEARTILETINHPTAKQWLAKLDDIDPENDLGDPFADAPAGLYQSDKRSTSAIPAPPSMMKARPSQFDTNSLQNAVAIFLQNDWQMTAQMETMVQVEKRRSPGSGIAAFLIVLLGWIGMLIVLAGIATSKVEKVTLQLQSNGSLQVLNRNQSFTVTAMNELLPLAKSVKKGATYGATLALGIIQTLILLFLFR